MIFICVYVECTYQNICIDVNYMLNSLINGLRLDSREELYVLGKGITRFRKGEYILVESLF